MWFVADRVDKSYGATGCGGFCLVMLDGGGKLEVEATIG